MQNYCSIIRRKEESAVSGTNKEDKPNTEESEIEGSATGNLHITEAAGCKIIAASIH